MGVKAEPALAAIADKVTVLALSAPDRSEVRATSGMKTSMAVSFIMSDEVRAITGMRSSISRLSEPFERAISLEESLTKKPDSSKAFEAITSDVIRDKLSQSISLGVLERKERSKMARMK